MTGRVVVGQSGRRQCCEQTQAVTVNSHYHSDLACLLLVLLLLCNHCCVVQVGLVAQQHEADVVQLVAELLPLGQAYLRSHNSSSRSICSSDGSATQTLQRVQQPEPGATGAAAELDHAAVIEQLLSYSLAIAAAVPSVEMARREFAWRNGFFLRLPAGRTPAHCEWLAKAGCADLLDSAGASSY